ncbi:hypothetical protein SL103_25010 [Streptomyces lydicus]|uniref:NarG-like domain-containing protein n=1 Tax=Streptomyces lydicus TaxID=47763 RepID=A0A1D7VQR1_9ACTN|nr:hypothetical protein SL103_25010 [Streptomyces lydicus]
MYVKGVPAVRAATGRSDRAVHPLRTAVLLAGLTATASGVAADSYDYRLGVSIWFRSPFALDPDVSAMGPPAPYRHPAVGAARGSSGRRRR